jgi:hypothetical protein
MDVIQTSPADMQSRELLRACVAAQVQGMDFERVYRLVIRPSGLWDGSSPTAERWNGAATSLTANHAGMSPYSSCHSRMAFSQRRLAVCLDIVAARCRVGRGFVGLSVR